MDEFINMYMVTALWSSTGDDGEPLDEYGIESIHPDTRKIMKDSCDAFIEENEDLLTLAYSIKDYGPSQAGMDFWLTRNGHGAGFWDRGIGNAGNKLAAACGYDTKYGEVALQLGDDGMIHQMGV